MVLCLKLLVSLLHTWMVASHFQLTHLNFSKKRLIVTNTNEVNFSFTTPFIFEYVVNRRIFWKMLFFGYTFQKHFYKQNVMFSHQMPFTCFKTTILKYQSFFVFLNTFIHINLWKYRQKEVHLKYRIFSVSLWILTVADISNVIKKSWAFFLGKVTMAKSALGCYDRFRCQRASSIFTTSFIFLALAVIVKIL